MGSPPRIAPTDADFREDATWRRVPGLSDRTLASFESSSTPGSYLRHRGALLFVFIHFAAQHARRAES
ncbi:AbfB domain-containing protein [Streptomyces anulatus]|uniref:AbfB domain-containing protein n=1 Tax=Streptomyces anulatus TaxID=1892 RepID=UPI0034327113